jgi:RNA polymerase sigma-70 factor (ECF subfamily)
MSPSPLEELLEKLNRGDTAAAEQVYRTYEPYLRKVIRRQLPTRLRRRFDSIDVVQSAWRDILHGLQKAGWRFTSTAQLQAFLVKVTRNRFIDRYRQHNRAVEREMALNERELQDLPAAQQPDPGAQAEAEELWDHLLHLCPAEHQELLRMRRQGAPLPEIAARTGLHPGSIRRILRKLASQLACETGGNQADSSPASEPSEGSEASQLDQ